MFSMRFAARAPSALPLLLLSLGVHAQAVSSPAEPDTGHGDTVALADTDAVQLDTVTVKGDATQQPDRLTAQTITSIGRDQFVDAPARTIADLLAQAPGVTFMQGNGPRDVSVSVRGSNTRQTFGVRNIKVFEDGFPVTQPDGLARTDLTDPHAYQSIDVLRGPSSAYFGNYATGGAIDFHTRTGREIQGIEGGVDLGSDEYANVYATAGGGDARFDWSAFASNVRGDPQTQHTGYLTTTLNLLSSWQATDSDRLTFKFINNDLDTDLSLRLSANQYALNPYQQHCETASDPATAAGCGSVRVFPNGFNGTPQSLSAVQAGLGRNDRRTIVGARWEHAVDASTDLRTQVVFDNRDISQPTSATSFTGTYPSFNLMSDLVHRSLLFGLPATSTAGVFANHENIKSNSFNLTSAGHASLGGITQHVDGEHLNAGARLREEIALAPQWTAVFGLGAEYTHLQATALNYRYPANANPTISSIEADREFVNVAPELALQFAASEDWLLHARASMGYGTPQATNLFVTSDGSNGNNTDLKAQRNLGFDLGAEWNVSRVVSASLTGFYEFFRNELVSQSAGVNSQSFTFNAPRSEHRGVEAALDLHLLPDALPGAHLAVSYLYDQQLYKDYTERLGNSTQTATFVRDGNDIPGVVPNTVDARLLYDQPQGLLQGLGGYVEFSYRDSYVLDNANLLDAAGYKLVNLNLHYRAPPERGVLSRLGLYVSVQNVFDKTYIASASNLSNTLNANGEQNGVDALRTATGSIYAGAPRSVFGGLRVAFK